MAYLPSKAVANEILNHSEAFDGFTPFQIQKLTYLAHGFYYALYGQPLINETVEAWKYGPVIPTLYHEFKEWGGNPIKRFALDFVPATGWFSKPEIPATPNYNGAKSVIDQVVNQYGHLSTTQLYNLTHEPGGPWDRAYEEGIYGKDIPNELIRDHFANWVNDANQSRAV
ncbi:Panacea domain-containing protein [Acanthopleuribacter pedis]|uniref:DUF4065 domain-containing protein n=1 Tax=Acanthopleuribacter pedis TaxID=442870 RepID=A0A8J7QG98_9BACT|nr:type II toxin-antitoxin system antitoxin SocA domain-containing protein [Acanthopleuribacter pedis]MBO1319505.1 DUF4065 domain-containing protein [Acanthopleuribacter pedis]